MGDFSFVSFFLRIKKPQMYDHMYVVVRGVFLYRTKKNEHSY